MPKEYTASPEEAVRTVQRRLRSLRDTLKLSQGDLANLLDVSRQTIVNWETKSEDYKMSGKDFLALSAIIEMKVKINPGIKGIIQAILDSPDPETGEPSPKIEIKASEHGSTAGIIAGAAAISSIGGLLGIVAGPIGLAGGLAGAWLLNKSNAKKKRGRPKSGNE